MPARSSASISAPGRGRARSRPIRGPSPRSSANTFRAIPTIVVCNMPGAGGIKAANYIYRIAPAGRHRLGLHHPRLRAARRLLKIPQAQFDPTRFTGSAATRRTPGGGGVDARTGVRTLQDATHAGGRVRRHLLATDTGLFPRIAQSPDRHQVQGHRRLREQHRRRSGDGARRGAGQGLDLGLAQERKYRGLGRGEEGLRAGAIRRAEGPRLAAICRWRSTTPNRPRIGK